MTLLEFAKKGNYTTDKLDLGYIDEFYNDLFSIKKDSVKKVLEIGIDRGESIVLWRDFFQNAEIYALDVRNCHRLNNQNRIHPIYGNAYSQDILSKFEKNSFDIIIDDGPHTYDTMCYFLDHYIDLLNDKGILILEDIIDISWTPKFLDRINSSKYSSKVVNMAGKQKTQTLMNTWKRGLDVIIVEKK